jgi:gliding motility-associated-like protein
MSLLLGQHIVAQVVYPSVSPEALYIKADGEEITDATDSQSAPLKGVFTSNVSDLGDYSVRYEWKIYRDGQQDAPLINRYDADLEYTFTESGTFYVQCYATFVHGVDTIVFPEDGAEEPFMVSISESVLEMPNAFSPNNDGYNDVYRAKEGYQSIVSFKATIFNRWGQKIYSWSELSGGWDGKCNGNVVNDGVYYVVVEARGADGKKYRIRRDVNVLTGYSGTGRNNK